MKKLLLSLCVLCLLLPAAAAEHYPGYTISDLDPMAVYPIDSHTVVVRCWPKNWQTAGLNATPLSILWLRDGQTVRRLDYYLRGATGDLDNTSFLPDGQGGFKVLLTLKTGTQTVSTGEETGREITGAQTNLFDWTDSGLQNSITLPGGWGYLACGTLVAACRQTADAQLEVRLLDLSGNLLDSAVLPNTQDHVLQTVWPWEDGYLIVTRASRIYYFTSVTDGQVRWQVCPVQTRDMVSYDMIPDGAGGFFSMVGNRSGSIDPLIAVHYDAEGRQDWLKTLDGDRLVKQIQGCVRDEKNGRTVLYGSAVANSRRIYTVFRLTLDAQWNVIAWDVRALDAAYRDYSPKIYLTPDGFPWVYTWAVGAEGSRASLPPAIVPFDTLPAGSAALTWKDGGSEYLP